MSDRECPVFKHLVSAAILCAPAIAWAGQGMSVDECLTSAASKGTVSEVDSAISPMREITSDTVRAPATGRGTDEADAHAQTDNTTSHNSPHANRAAGTDAASSTHTHKGGHGRAPWQSLLPGVMK
jgi:hypothetical protein